jgi:hypothetical protein
MSKKIEENASTIDSQKITLKECSEKLVLLQANGIYEIKNAKKGQQGYLRELERMQKIERSHFSANSQPGLPIGGLSMRTIGA